MAYSELYETKTLFRDKNWVIYYISIELSQTLSPWIALLSKETVDSLSCNFEPAKAAQAKV